MTAAALLDAGGALASALPGHEARPGQLQMAAAVEQALERSRVLLVEAGTGTGKTLAYLVPAIQSGKKVVISTATRALQEQIVRHDVPLVERALGRPVALAVMKGLSNYICRRRLLEAAASADASRGADLQRILDLAANSSTGDVVELDGFAEDHPLLRDVTSSSDTRIGQRCAHYRDCFVTRMKRDAEAARVVVVNHHLFFADLALRGPHPASVIPDYDAVIFDEAHQIEDVATEFFGLRVSRARLERLLLEAERLAAPAERYVPEARTSARRIGGDLQHAAEAFWAELSALVPAEDTRAAVERDAFAGPLERAYFGLDAALEGFEAFGQSLTFELQHKPSLRSGSPSPGELSEAFEMLARRAASAREQLAAIHDTGAGRVSWVEIGRRNVTLSSSPVDIAGTLHHRVFSSVPAVVLTSATLADTGAKSGPASTPFGYLRRRLGIVDPELQVDELIVPSPFDYAGQALLYTPRDLPPPGTREFIDAAAERIADLVEITDGGAFVLTTSVRAMKALHGRLRAAQRGRSVLLQGEAPKASLLALFKADGRSVLVATSSFWEGVDVPGDALRLVVLEKIPFAVPSDPIIKARALAIESDGGNPFMEMFVPAAALSLKQGFGRLIRTRSDYGVVALLDERVHRRGYGKRLLAALPPAGRCTELEPVRAFWRQHAGGAER